MKFAAGLTVTGILGFLLLEALKIIMVPVTGWVIALLAFLLKAVLIVLALGVVGVLVAIGIFIYKRLQKAPAEA